MASLATVCSYLRGTGAEKEPPELPQVPERCENQVLRGKEGGGHVIAARRRLRRLTFAQLKKSKMTFPPLPSMHKSRWGTGCDQQHPHHVSSLLSK